MIRRRVSPNFFREKRYPDISDTLKKVAAESAIVAALKKAAADFLKFLKPIKKGFLQSFSGKRRRRDRRKPEVSAPGLFLCF